MITHFSDPFLGIIYIIANSIFSQFSLYYFEIPHRTRVFVIAGIRKMVQDVGF